MTKQDDSFDPYYKWLGIPPHEQPANHYRLLGVSLFESNADVISNAVDRIMAHVRGFQTGKRARAAQQVLTEISSAKIVLLNPEKKAAYDADLRATIEVDDPLAGPLPEAVSVGTFSQPTPAPFTDLAETETSTVTSRAKGASRTSSAAAAMGMVGLAIAVLLLMGGVGAAFVLAPSLFQAADDPVDVAVTGDPKPGDDEDPATDAGTDGNPSPPPATGDGVDSPADSGGTATDSSELDGKTPVDPPPIDPTPVYPGPGTDGEEPLDPSPPITTDPVPPPNLTPLPGVEEPIDPPPIVASSRQADVPLLADRQTQRKRITDLFAIAEATTVETQVAMAKRILDAAALSQVYSPSNSYC